jgi:hypothetical protein
MLSSLKLFVYAIVLILSYYFVSSLNNYYTIKAEHTQQQAIIDEIVSDQEEENVVLVEMERKGSINEGNRDVYIKIMQNNGYISDDKFNHWLHEDEL